MQWMNYRQLACKDGWEWMGGSRSAQWPCDVYIHNTHLLDYVYRPRFMGIYIYFISRGNCWSSVMRFAAVYITLLNVNAIISIFSHHDPSPRDYTLRSVRPSVCHAQAYNSWMEWLKFTSGRSSRQLQLAVPFWVKTTTVIHILNEVLQSVREIYFTDKF